MPGEDFKSLFGLGVDRRRFTYWQRFMHHFEKRKSLRVAVVIGVGVFMVGNLMTIVPGTKYIFQKEIKEATARSFLKLSYLSTRHTESTAIETPPEWHSSIRTVHYYTDKFQREVSLRQKVMNPFLMASQVDLLSCAVKRCEKDLSLLYRSLDELACLLEWVIKENPKMFRNRELYEALLACFNAVIAASLLPDRIASSIGLTPEERLNWSTFLSLCLLLLQFRSEPTLHLLILQGLVTVAHSRPWLYRIESQDLMAVLFKYTKNEEKPLREAALGILCEAVEAGAGLYIENRLISNLLVHVVPKFQDVEGFVVRLMNAAMSMSPPSSRLVLQRPMRRKIPPPPSFPIFPASVTVHAFFPSQISVNSLVLPRDLCTDPTHCFIVSFIDVCHVKDEVGVLDGVVEGLQTETTRHFALF